MFIIKGAVKMNNNETKLSFMMFDNNNRIFIVIK